MKQMTQPILIQIPKEVMNTRYVIIETDLISNKPKPLKEYLEKLNESPLIEIWTSIEMGVEVYFEKYGEKMPRLQCMEDFMANNQIRLIKSLQDLDELIAKV